MKKIIKIILTIFFLIITLSILLLSTVGIKTKSFNKVISNKVNEIDKNSSLRLDFIRFKLDIEELSLYLETFEPNIEFRKTLIPTEKIKVYVNFVSLLKSSPKINKINFKFNELNASELRKLSIVLKPSNIKKTLNKIKKGKIKPELDLFFDNKNKIESFIVKGSVNNMHIYFSREIILKNTSFNFFGDNSDILIKNIESNLEGIQLRDGDLQVKLRPELSIKSNFLSNFNFRKEIPKKFINLIKNNNIKNVENIEAISNNNLLINFDKTYKIKNYELISSGNINNANIDFKKPLNTFFLDNGIKKLSIFKSEFKIFLNSKNKKTLIKGKYSADNSETFDYEINNESEKDFSNTVFNINFDKAFDLNIINYRKMEGIPANLSAKLERRKNSVTLKSLVYKENNSSISVEDLKIKNQKIFSLKKLVVKTQNNQKFNNDFEILMNNKIIINGSNFDATKIPEYLNSKKPNNNVFSSFNKEVEVNIKNTKVPLSENLKNFRLIGLLENNKFTKISAKGDFGNNQFLDITMKKNDDKNEKYLEIFSDLPQPLLSRFNFFNGLTGGKLMYTSNIYIDKTISKLAIENFKVVNAPGMIKLLSLADLGGLADLAAGEGISFDSLEIKMEKNKELLKLNEILAIGPSISVLMEGYQDSEVTSLRGTLVPAKTLNKMISKIPVLGEIVIPKEVGEGLFGISFKIKGPKDKLKTSINPIRTITPRFIQKIIDRNKVAK